jgi:glycosyltransferase involved in cell wall biosynthesis
MSKSVYIVGLSRFQSPSGICRYAFNLADTLSSIDNTNVTLVIGDWQEKYYRNSFDWTSVKATLKVVSIRNTSFNRNFWFLFQLPFLINKEHINWLFLSFPIPFIGFLTPKTKIITAIHDLYAFEFPQNFRFPFFNRLFTKLSARSARNLSALSYVTADKVKKYLPSYSDKILVNYTTFSYDKINYENALMEDYYLTVAQHRKNKNIDILIRAFGKLKQVEKNNSTKLLIIGSEGPETENLHNLVIDYGIVNDVIFKEGVADNELINYYLNAKCFLLLSATEGLGIPLIESLYYCKHIICSDIEVFREIDNENCTFINLDKNIEKRLVESLMKDIIINKKFGIKDKRFTKAAIRNNYKSLLNGK